MLKIFKLLQRRKKKPPLLERRETEKSQHPEIREMAHNLTKIIALLPPHCRQVFYFSAVEGLTEAQIALRLNMTSFTVHDRLAFAIEHIKNNIDDYRLLLNTSKQETTNN